jgi:hypothetical protein
MYSRAAEEIGSNGNSVRVQIGKLTKKLRDNDCLIESVEANDDAASAATTPTSKGRAKKRKAVDEDAGTPTPKKAAQGKGAAVKNEVLLAPVEMEETEETKRGRADDNVI